jgi:hypothetical protein
MEGICPVSDLEKRGRFLMKDDKKIWEYAGQGAAPPQTTQFFCTGYFQWNFIAIYLSEQSLATLFLNVHEIFIAGTLVRILTIFKNPFPFPRVESGRA